GAADGVLRGGDRLWLRVEAGLLRVLQVDDREAVVAGALRRGEEHPAPVVADRAADEVLRGGGPIEDQPVLAVERVVPHLVKGVRAGELDRLLRTLEALVKEAFRVARPAHAGELGARDRLGVLAGR